MKLDEGYFFGVGAFETIGVEEGIPLFLEEHCIRLQQAMEFFQLEFSLEQAREKIFRALEDPWLQQGRKALKITASPENLVITARDNPYEKADYQRGFRLDFSSVRRNETSPLTYHKTLNYGDCLLEKRKAKERGMDETVFLNTRGEIAEGTAANVFFVKKGHILTPKGSCGLLPGIVRSYVCQRYKVTECDLHPQDVKNCEEMFLTSSLLGIMPVHSLDGYVFPSRLGGQKLMKDYGNLFTKKSLKKFKEF